MEDRIKAADAVQATVGIASSRGGARGKAPSYRVDPRQVVEMFDFITEKKKKD
jgi:hypothetical protein